MFRDPQVNKTDSRRTNACGLKFARAEILGRNFRLNSCSFRQKIMFCARMQV